MSRFDALARRAGRAASLARIAGRTLLPIDTNPVPADWSHVTKVDPEDEKRLPLLFPLYLAHTSAVSVGGSRDVTAANTEATFELLSWAGPPAFHEPSDPTHVTDATREAGAFLAVPEVLNGGTDALIGTLGAGVEYIRDELAPGEIDAALPVPLPAPVRDALADFATGWLLESAVFEAYLIQNLDSAAARESAVTEADLVDPERAAHLATAAERHLDSEVIYLEYSGTFGGDEAAALLSAIDDAVSWSRLWYGGGLDSAAAAEKMLAAGADAVVVGNAFHEVAAEEERLGERAAAAFDSVPDRNTVRDWLTDEVDVADTAAARYLSTCPTVDDPTSLATRYLVGSLRLWLALDGLPAGVDGDAEAAWGRLAERLDGTLPTGAAGSRGDAGRDPDSDGTSTGRVTEPYLRTLTRSCVAGGEPPLPVDHLSLDVDR